MVRNTLLCRSSRDRCHIEFSWYSIVPECNTIFLAFTQTFLLHRDIVDKANGRQNRHYFPILCIFTQALVDLTNNSQVFSLTLSRIFHLLAKKWLKKSHVYEFTDTKQTTGCESFARLSENLWRHLFAALRFETIPVAIIFLTRALCLLKILWIRICRHLPLVTTKMLADILALLLLHTMLNRWCGSPVKAIEKQRISKRQGPLFCRKWSKVWD